MTVTLQIQLESGMSLTPEELKQIEGEMNICCSKLEPLCYIRAQMFVNDKAYNG